MADKHTPLFIQFARAPVEGQVKTRMIPYLNPRQACDLHRELVLWTCRRLVASGLGEVELAIAGDESDSLFEQCREVGVTAVWQQRGQDLGKRMCRAIECGLRRHSQVLLVGSDCPGINADYLERALCALEEAPLVFGPARDGGYVLIGATAISGELFRGIDWGTSQVYAQTTAIMQKEKLDWVELPLQVDIDRPEDLAVWQEFRAGES